MMSLDRRLRRAALNRYDVLLRARGRWLCRAESGGDGGRAKGEARLEGHADADRDRCEMVVEAQPASHVPRARPQPHRSDCSMCTCMRDLYIFWHSEAEARAKTCTPQIRLSLKFDGFRTLQGQVFAEAATEAKIVRGRCGFSCNPRPIGWHERARHPLVWTRDKCT